MQYRHDVAHVVARRANNVSCIVDQARFLSIEVRLPGLKLAAAATHSDARVASSIFAATKSSESEP